MDNDKTLKVQEIDGVKYFELYIKCPVCLENNVENNPLRGWEHADCGGTMFVGSNGYLRCECGHSDPIVKWKYHCNNHDSLGLGKYVSVTNVKVLSSVFSIAGQLVLAAGQDWFLELMYAIDKQFKETPQN